MIVLVGQESTPVVQSSNHASSSLSQLVREDSNHETKPEIQRSPGHLCVGNRIHYAVDTKADMEEY